ncbi:MULTISPECIES: anthranilate synthase component I family protein [unclassified Saccharibacter]|uniref:anthranilate synthase component I family protein n=1 Tax=unclassified Saccharibacter TaxID=2648722 RepID=UPI00132380C7|nr:MULTISPECIES: anthranilate synthase component I family protein [unclassified Saccharibacter]MXV36932.1 anthranilate synthase component I family protein [Saccharibacter sp. EH611]MXV58578.1 anthranilate synthase component I family protein [Saccharibacter sp. EH70]MXV66084.1 anthranilate synthase component I family protein [Saccharibacter sp. EH60]
MPTSAPLCTLLPWCPPEHLLTLCHNQPQSVFLDSGGDPKQDRHRWSILCPRPSASLSVLGFDPSAYWNTLRQFWREHTPPASPHCKHLPFSGGVIGLASYEAGLACEGLHSRHPLSTPPLTALACRDLFVIDRREQALWWVSPDGTPPPPLPEAPPPSSTLPPLRWQADYDEQAWHHTIDKVRAYIQQGDIFQANITMRWHSSRPERLDLLSLYQRMRTRCPAPFGAWFHTANTSLLSASVERFLSLSPDGTIETRPIKGTTGIDPDPTRNAALRSALTQDTKELAENLMITDLMRHDIGRVCALGSITVPQLCAVERFEHVHHLVSSVQGTLKNTLDGIDLLAATVPPGSVTGAPKHRALEIIDEVERSSRGAYCGTLFRLGWDGSLDSSVIIRSISATAHQLSLGAGGGITWPSDAQREYHETLLKAAPLLALTEPSS